MYNNTMLDDWISAIDACILKNIKNGEDSKLQIDPSDKDYFNKLINEIPELYKGKLIKEKVKCYGEIGFISSLSYFLVFNMNEENENSNRYNYFVNTFTFNGNINYRNLIQYLSCHKDILSIIFNDIIDRERERIIIGEDLYNNINNKTR